MQGKDSEERCVVTEVSGVEVKRVGKGTGVNVETEKEPGWDGGVATVQNGESVSGVVEVGVVGLLQEGEGGK